MHGVCFLKQTQRQIKKTKQNSFCDQVNLCHIKKQFPNRFGTFASISASIRQKHSLGTFESKTKSVYCDLEKNIFDCNL